MKGIASACVLVFVISTLQQDVAARRPKMTPNVNELLIQEGDDLRIQCQGEGRIQFSKQSSKQYLPSYIKQSNFTTSFDEASGTYTFIQPRTITRDTGWYACAEESIEIKNDEETIEHPSDDISWIYVYVNSSAPFAYMENIYHAVSITAGSDAVIPCRPTSPNLPVILEIESGETPVPEDTIYDPKIGFILKAVGKERDGESYSCQLDLTYTEDDVPEWPTYYAIVSVVLPTPAIDENSLRHVVLGENMTLECTITSEEFLYSLNWTVPTSVPKDRIIYAERISYDTTIGYKRTWKANVTIKDVEKSDAGVYTCTAKSTRSESTASKEIKISDPDYSYFNLSVDGEEDMLLLEDQTAAWEVKVDMYPGFPVFEWYKEDGTAIADTEKDSRVSRYSHTRNGTVHHFRISRLTIEDSGRYTIRASTQWVETSIVRSLRVWGQPVIHMDSTSRFYAPGVTVTFMARILASPRPNVTWSYIEYPDFPSKLNSTTISLSNLHTEWIEKPPFGTASRVNVTINMTGDLICRSCNDVNCTESTRQIFVSDVAGFFGIRDPGVVTEGDNVNLTCGASVYNYTDDVAWRLKDFQDQEFDSDRTHVTKLKTKFTSQSILHIRNVLQSDSGEYTCEAVNKEGRHDRESYTLRVEGLSRRNSQDDHDTSLVKLQASVLANQIKVAEAQARAAISLEAVARSLERLTDKLERQV